MFHIWGEKGMYLRDHRQFSQFCDAALELFVFSHYYNLRRMMRFTGIYV